MLDWRIPYLTDDIPGIGGVMRVEPEDFRVEEIPAYAPCGAGEHTFFRVEKRDLSTPALIRQLALALDVPERDISAAGLKDARAVAEQTLSVQGASPERVLALSLERAQILWAERHTNKLRMGHLRGNRFTLRLRNVAPDAEARATAIFAQLTARGVPNGYGVQRFGNHGDNHEIGLLLLRRDAEALQARRLGRLSGRQRGFYISALQSALFNRVLAVRMARGLLDDLLPGDIAKKQETGGLFTVEEVEVERPRVAAWEISPTGPMYGYKLMPARSEAAALEAAVLAEAGLTLEDFRPARAEGTRRPLRYRPEGLAWEMEPADVLRVSFFAPKGAYATLLLRELMKTETPLDVDTDAD